MRYISTTATFFLGLITSTLSPLSTSAATLLLEDFNSLPVRDYLTGQIIPTTIGSGFLVVEGSIDVRDQSRFFSEDIGAGNVVDLNGLRPSLIRSVETFTFNPGTVTLSFALSGSQGERRDTNPVTVSLGDLYSETFTLPFFAPFRTITRTLNVSSPTTANLVFDSRLSGNDLSGLLLDNVVLSTPDVTTSIPENSSPLAVFLSFFMGAWLLNKGNRRFTSQSYTEK